MYTTNSFTDEVLFGILDDDKHLSPSRYQLKEGSHDSCPGPYPTHATVYWQRQEVSRRAWTERASHFDACAKAAAPSDITSMLHVQANVQTAVLHTYVCTHTHTHTDMMLSIPEFPRQTKWTAREREEKLGRWKVLFRWFAFRLKFLTTRAKIEFHKKPVLKGQVVTGSVLSTSQMWPNLQ